MKIAIVGDSHATYLPSDANKGIPGLPAWDIELKEMTESLITQDYDRIYLSPGFYLVGVKKAEKAIEASKSNIFIPCQKEDRSFYSKSNWRKFILNEDKSKELYDAWAKAVKTLYNLSDNIWLLPLSMYWFEMKIKKEKIIKNYSTFCAKFSRIINVEPILKKNPFFHNNKFGRLTKEGISLLQPILKEH
ncbi:hypothetical protein [Okeania sp. SIO2B3]|uniref:hypothetical protein n=1 Tax=Okeania sp. SIO2B3 TaxID=2607784 RepID=UPI0013BF1104|nr:hypothetical protein [Okeania sp. SIO2B3]NET40580.1 hypothetical protein [Okeania sp. SIO2B3]